MKKEVKIDFEELRDCIMLDARSYELYCYVHDVFQDLQDIANLDGTSILEQLEYANKVGSYSCDTSKTVNKLKEIYFPICDFITDYKREIGEDLSKLYFENIKVFEIYLLYDLYFKYIQEYDSK
jgi:hypothetical protein